MFQCLTSETWPHHCRFSPGSSRETRFLCFWGRGGGGGGEKRKRKKRERKTLEKKKKKKRTMTSTKRNSISAARAFQSAFWTGAGWPDPGPQMQENAVNGPNNPPLLPCRRSHHTESLSGRVVRRASRRPGESRGSIPPLSPVESDQELNRWYPSGYFPSISGRVRC